MPRTALAVVLLALTSMAAHPLAAESLVGHVVLYFHPEQHHGDRWLRPG